MRGSRSIWLRTSPKIAEPAVKKLIICNYLSQQIYWSRSWSKAGTVMCNFQWLILTSNTFIFIIYWFCKDNCYKFVTKQMFINKLSFNQLFLLGFPFRFHLKRNALLEDKMLRTTGFPHHLLVPFSYPHWQSLTFPGCFMLLCFLLLN